MGVIMDFIFMPSLGSTWGLLDSLSLSPQEKAIMTIMKKMKGFLIDVIITVQSKKEKGCTEPLTGEKSKCVLQIVPKTTVCESFQMDEQCKKVRIIQEE